MPALKFFVPGKPASAGSKEFKGLNKDGRAIIVDSCKDNDSWRSLVQGECMRAMAKQNHMRQWPKGSVLSVTVTFYMPRPKKDYDKHGNLRPNAPMYHTQDPDATKLWRSSEDALNKLLWHDDCEVAAQRVEKVFEYPGQPCGAAFMIETIEQVSWDKFHERRKREQD
jgi:Holliday junction resolvase RusA-like endonuclease